MKTFVLITVLIGAALAEDYYDVPKVNIDDLVKDMDQLRKMSGCFVGTGPCTEITSSYKATIPESLSTDCRKCSPDTKHVAHTYLTAIKEKTPDDYSNFLKHYSVTEDAIEAFIKKL